jgi:drug/metabolite transporter (DMT)-like permease
MPNFAPSLTAALAWGAMFPIAHSALERTDAVHLTVIRYGLATLLFLAILALVEGRRSLRFDGHGRRVFVLGTAGFAGFNLLAFAALGHTSPEHAALIVATSPIITLLARWATAGAKPSRGQLAAVVAAFLGVGLVITNGHPSAIVDGGIGIGELMVFVGVLTWVGYTMGGASLGHWSPLRFTALTAAMGTLSIIAIAVVGDLAGWFTVPSAGDVGAIGPQIVYVVLIGSLVGVLSWNHGVARLGIANAALFMNVVPVTAFVIESIRGTTPAPAELAGAGITVAALIAANLLGRRAVLQGPLEERDDRLEEVVRRGRGGERVQVARAAAAIDQG